MRVTKNHHHAVEHDGRYLQLIACAGSGKTEVVTRRVVHLLTPGRQDSLLPGNIIVFTFTEKATAEALRKSTLPTRAGTEHVRKL